jgi:hypothetical protein
MRHVQFVWCYVKSIKNISVTMPRSWCSSASIVCDYILDDRVRSPAEVKDFSSSLCVQTSSGPPNLLYNGYRGVLSPRLKRGLGVTLTTDPHLVSKLGMRSYISSLSCRLHGVAGQFYFA